MKDRKPLVTNAGDEKQAREANQKLKRREDREREDLRRILETDYGRRFIWKLLGDCRIYQISFTGNSETFFNEGRRDVGLRLLADVNAASLDHYLLMQKEAMKNDE